MTRSNQNICAPPGPEKQPFVANGRRRRNLCRGSRGVAEARVIQNDTLHIVFKGIVELEVAQWRAAGRRVLEWMWRKRSEEVMNT